jgi:hypothetical protein
MSNPVTYLSVNVVWRSGKSDPSYFQQLEDAIHQLATRFRGVVPITSDASDTPEGEFSESFTLALNARASADDLTAAIISEIQTIGMKKGYSFTLFKRIPLKQGFDEYKMKVHPHRTATWTQVSSKPLGRRSAKADAFPPELNYLQAQAEEYYGAGGKDVFSVFGGEVNVAAYFGSLSKQQILDLRETYKRIVENKDHLRVMNWLTEVSDGKVSMAKARALYFLVFLERLCDAGLLDGTPGLRRVKLVDWRRLEE